MHIRVATKDADDDTGGYAIKCDDGVTILCSHNGWPVAVQVEVEEPAFVRSEFASLAGTARRTIDAEVKAWFGELRETSRVRLQRAVDTFRWRTGRSDVNSVIASLWIRISADGSSWQPPPIDFSELRFGIPGVPSKTDDTEQLTSARELLQTGKEQPLAHELLREAWSQRDVSPRSSIVLAVAAVEVGVKSYIASRIPLAEWLVENLPSPPLDKLIEKYIDKLKPTCHFADRAIRPPASVVKPLKEAIELRNKIVHRGDVDRDREKINAILLASRDLLYILDVYEGAQWAAEHIRPETMASWSAPK